jgi:hypothetical protein
MNTVSTISRSKYQQDTKRKTLRKKSERYHERNAQLPTFVFSTGYPSQQNIIQIIKINVSTLTDPDTIRNFFKAFISTKSFQPGIKEDLFTNILSLQGREQEQCDAPLTLQELTIVLHSVKQGKSLELEGLTSFIRNSRNCSVLPCLKQQLRV